MEGSFMDASFQPPAVDPADANPSRYPSWVLLDSRAYFADRDNATTVKATTSTGHDVKVTFCLADPPAVSYFCVHFPGISVQECCTTEPSVVSSVEELVLLCFAFRTESTDPRSTDEDSQHIEYFVYKAASDGKHTIRSVPRSPPAYKHSCRAAIVPLEGDEFLIADLSPNEDLGQYNLHIFCSDTDEWSTTHLKLQAPGNVMPMDLPILVDKVILLGSSTVGWVDLWRGIIVCDVLEMQPVLRFLPLPRADFDLHRKTKARQSRDVVGFPDGHINFVEIEHRANSCDVVPKRTSKTAKIFDVADTIYDEELLSIDDDMDDAAVNRLARRVPAGWKIRTMCRSIDWDYWLTCPTLHVDHISAYPPEPSKLVSHLWDDIGKKWTLGNLKTTGFPTFSFYGGNVVYLVSKVESQDIDALLVGFDIGKRKLEVLKPYRYGRSIPFGPIPLVCVDIGKMLEGAGRSTSFDPISCNFSDYMNITPSPRPCGAKVAAEQSAQNGVLNDHLSSSDIVPNNVQPQQNTCNGYDPYGNWSGYGYGTHPGYYGNYQQPVPFQPPSLTQTGQPMSSSTSTQFEGYIYAHWTLLDAYGRMHLSVPLNEMYNPFALWTPPMPPRPPFAPGQFFAQPMTSMAEGYVVLGHGQHQMMPFLSLTHREQMEYHGPRHQPNFHG